VVAKSLFMKPTRLLVADVIGLGKTITALRILKTIDSYKRLNWVLIAVPSVLVDQWIDEMKSMGITPTVIDSESLDILAEHPELPAGWYIGSIDTLKQPEYMAILRKVEWDAIVVDEAHKLGIIGGEANKRLQNLGEIIRNNRDATILLLSATPHRGKANDYLARLALLDPSLLEVANLNTLDKAFDKPEFYQQTHNTILFRRSKDDVNEVYERRQVFKPCNMLAVLVEPNDVEKTLLRTTTELATSYLGSYHVYLIDAFGWKTGRVQGITALLRTLLVKRGLSSPQALVNTFGKLVEKRGKFIELIEQGYSPEEAWEKIAEELEEYDRRLNEILTGDPEDIEKELDKEFDELASYLDRFLDEEFRDRLKKIKESAEQILAGKVPDSKLETLKKILKLVLKTPPDELPEEFRDLASGKAIIFTEFKDTAYYLYERLKTWAEREFGESDIVRVFTSENRGDIEDIKKWLSEDGRKVLITTDVAGEGLNLQYANVLVNYEIAWSPIRLEQRIGRVWRYGQNRTTYVFNLFMADALEKNVADIVFAKLYGISISVGKLEPILGEKVLISTIRNELLEHAVEERGSIGGLIPVEMDLNNRRITLSEAKIIELVATDAQAFVEAFIKALKKLVSEIKQKRIFPQGRTDAERVREELYYLTGFRDNDDVLRAGESIAETIARLLGMDIERRDNAIFLRSRDGTVYDFPKTSPDAFARRLIDYFKVEDSVKYFVYQGSEKEVVLLSEAEVSIGGEVRYREPIGIVADFEKHEIKILRGRDLVEKISDLLARSIPVDEVYGLDNILSSIPQIVSASHNTYYEKVVRRGAGNVIELLKKYEDAKKKHKGISYFEVGEPQVSIGEPVFTFISTAFLPEITSAPSEEVWGWAEDEAIPIVFNYEGLNGREAIRVSSYEHYDVKSLKRDSNGNVVEERFIEVKTKTRRDIIHIKLEGSEYLVAEEKDEKYWLYIVYGVRTEKPAILCIRKPHRRLPLRKTVVGEIRERYSLDLPGLRDVRS